MPVPLEGVDPDGDSVSLVGLEIDNAPRKGSITFDGSSIVYTAASGEQTRGTDTLSCVFEDEFGRHGPGEVRNGIAATPSYLLQTTPSPHERDALPAPTLLTPVPTHDI